MNGQVHLVQKIVLDWVQFRTMKSCTRFSSVTSNSLSPHGLQHAGLPVHHQLPELIQTHIHWVGDAIQPSHPLLSPSPPAFNLFQCQGLPMSQFFTSGDQNIGASTSASVLPMNIQGWFPLGWTGWMSLQSKGLLSGFSSTTIQKHQSYVWVNVKPQNLQQGRKQRKVLSTPVTPLTRENSHTQVTWASPASNILVTLALPSWTK